MIKKKKKVDGNGYLIAMLRQTKSEHLVILMHVQKASDITTE